ncbi:MAG: nucleotidyl transferase AbiEii/AbiGii toxin family protein [Proteobacteria bacterium]|nr:nucleotidyl transferase AbiEii/AbiGii toxin family protein [Pseudomonadota bacterium]
MKKSNEVLLQDAPHLDTEGFRAAVEYTSRTTGFRMDLIEKDYFCSIALACLYTHDTPLIFKGGTCLNKVHVGFYRLSEDLDFSIPVNHGATRGDRRKAIEPVKVHLASFKTLVPALQLESELAGHNEGRQYTTVFSYMSIVTGKKGTIKFEVGLREPLLDKVLQASAQTLLMDPFKRSQLLSAATIFCLSTKEAFAEKIRAALARKDAAIRDLFDLDHAIRHKKIDMQDADLLDLARLKLNVPGTNAVDISQPRIDAMRRQLTTELQPVLRPSDFAVFDFDEAAAQLVALSEVLKLAVR